MSSIAARALGKTGAGAAARASEEQPDEQPRRSSLRQRLAGGAVSKQQEGQSAEPEAPQESLAPIDENEFGFETDAPEVAFADPLADEAVSEEDFADAATPFDEDYESALEEETYDDEVSQFEYRAPFTAQRNPVKMWTLAAAIFALMATGTIFAVNYYGLPDWVPVSRPTYGIGKPDLILNFSKANQVEETLDTGEVIFRVRGSIDNVGRETVSVPQLIVVFTDEGSNTVFSKAIAPSKSELAPGESLKVTEGIAGYPGTSKTVGIGWSPR